jgi:hypothetical protein
MCRCPRGLRLNSHPWRPGVNRDFQQLDGPRTRRRCSRR